MTMRRVGEQAPWTAGPWLLIHTAELGTLFDVTGTGGRIGATTQAGRIAKVTCIPATWGDHNANARLIAEAPALVELAATLVTIYSDRDTGELFDDAPGYARTAGAILARVKGDQQDTAG